MLLALQGVTVLAEPRVSRETILETLRAQAVMLKEARTELKTVGTIVRSLAAEATDNRRILQNLQEDCKSNKKEIDDLFRTTANHRIEMDDLGLRLAALYTIKETVEDQGNKINNLRSNFEAYKTEMGEYQLKTNNSILLLDHKNNETQFGLKELRTYVDHFGDNLILGSNQITVDSSAGFSTRPLSLLEVLKKTNGTINDMDNTLQTQGASIEKNASDIATKADDSILFNVDTLESKVKAIEAHLKREEEQGVSAIRKQTEQLLESVDQIQFQLMDKVSQEAVDNIVHKKYEDIVQYLKDALSSSAEDENNFKLKADELSDIVVKLNSSKADRSDLSAMQEIVIRAESMLNKLSSQGGAKNKDTYSKKEVEAFLELKVDKADFEQQLSSVAKGRKKKLSTTLGLPSTSVQDEALLPAASREVAMWKGLADVMKDESDAAMIRATQSSRQLAISGKSNNDFSSYIKSKKATIGIGRPNPSAMSLPDSTGGGAFRPASEGLAPGGRESPTQARPESPPDGSYGYAEAYMLTGSAYGGALNDIISKNKIGMPNVPVPPVSEHDITFMGGAHSGAGFNMKGGRVSHGAMKPLGGIVAEEDVEGRGLMVKGADGNLYYTDISELDVAQRRGKTIEKKLLSTH